ncbi:hypothetical protein J1782_25230 [Rahnella sp. BCC 1045]|jgi:hypothetical protein|uniref:hypothetical protein n=1 Tax=Rahnella sp. BCC 1045 TaxID=2816251 RepID=UPI001C278A44|nr:hypothetical protein [Rahnella sp. BCC 1045]MBU9823198.1 hypothetical protein [Rahnella sp. BCC 1045]
MRYLFLSAMLLLAFDGSAAGMDEVYAKINGTCTAQTCPPGSLVQVVATPSDTGDAQGSDGEIYPLLSLTGIKLRVVRQDEKCSVCAVTSVAGGMSYSIDRAFLKRAK